MEWFTFKTGSDHYGIDAEMIYRVVEDVQVATVALMPEFYLGLAYYRGELFDVFDLVRLMGDGKTDPSAISRMFLVKWDNKKMALVTDKIIGIIWTENEAGTAGVMHTDDYTIKFVQPDEIWQRALDQIYGPRQIP